MKKKILILFSLILAICINTHGLFGTYFQQDEWFLFGDVISLSHSSIANWFGIIGTQHVVPFSEFFWFLLYKFFGYNTGYYVATSLTLHVVASFLVYILAKKLSNSTSIGFLTSLLFAMNVRASSAYTHLAIFSHTITSFIFIILFLIYLLHVLEKNRLRKKDALILIAIFITSVFFREDGLILIPLTPISVFIFKRKFFNKKNLWFFVSFFAVSLSFLAFRFLAQMADRSATPILKVDYFLIYLYNIISLPIKFIIQNIFDGTSLFTLFLRNDSTSLFYEGIHFFDMYPVFMDLIFLIIFNLFVLLFFLAKRFFQQKHFWENICFCILFILLNAFILASVSRRLYIVESRYLYLSSFAVFFMLSLVLVGIYNSKKINEIIRKIIVVIIIVIFLINSYLKVQGEIKEKQFNGSVRRKILVEIMRLHPKIPSKTIFFVRCKNECHRNGEFNVPNKYVLPFTSGPGWIIMLEYAKKDEVNYYPFFVKQDNGERFLWSLGAEGYRNIGSYSFGYFYNKDSLKEILKKEKLDKNIIIGLEYNEDNFNMRDISEEVRKDL